MFKNIHPPQSCQERIISQIRFPKLTNKMSAVAAIPLYKIKIRNKREGRESREGGQGTETWIWVPGRSHPINMLAVGPKGVYSSNEREVM